MEPGAVIVLIFALAIYFLPALIAQHRKHPRLPAIIVLNLLLGWTLIGWVVALVWSFVSPIAASVQIQPQPSLPPPQLCPHCGKYIAGQGGFCPHCGKETEMPKQEV